MHAAMVWNPHREEIFVYGGLAKRRKVLADLWSWNGERWTHHKNRGDVPGPCFAHAMAYDEARKRLVLVGGVQKDTQSAQRGTWEWDGDRWSVVRSTDAPRPASRAWHSMVYDPDGERILLFGGRQIGRGPRMNDVWEYAIPDE